MVPRMFGWPRCWPVPTAQRTPIAGDELKMIADQLGHSSVVLTADIWWPITLSRPLTWLASLDERRQVKHPACPGASGERDRGAVDFQRPA
jgi:hypothetical protein